MSERRYHVIFNPNAGTALASGITTEAIADLFTRAGLDFEIDAESGDLKDRVRKALSSPADVIVAAGGDGTVLTVAAALLDSDKILGVLPFGTLNGLARDLGLALDPAAAIAQLASLEPRAIDVGEVNGRPFLHNVIVGLIPDIAVGREWIRKHEGWAARWRFLRFMARRMSYSRRIALALQSDQKATRVELVQTLVVANNSYDQRIGKLLSRYRLDRGTMTVYLIRSLRVLDAIRLAFEMLVGRWREDEVIEFEKVKELTVSSRRKRVLVTMDGEVLRLSTPLRFRVLPLSLRVLAPPQAVEPARDAPAGATVSAAA